MDDYLLTDAEVLILGLLAEASRHGYDLENEIERRGLREWAPIGFSSIYFVLGKLQQAGLVTAQKPAGPKTRKTFSITPAGRHALRAQTLAALSRYRPTYSSALLGLLHVSELSPDQAQTGLVARKKALAAESDRLKSQRVEAPPALSASLTDLKLGQLKAEAEWVDRTLGELRRRG